MTEAAVYMDNVQTKRKERKKTCNHMLSSVRDLMMIYIDGEFHENALNGVQIIQ